MRSALPCLTGFFFALGSMALAETKGIFLEDNNGARIEIGTLKLGETGDYEIAMSDAAFSDHFLSMRPFKCLDGAEKTWCHVPYPYEIKRDLSADLTDLEYDLLFLWKRSNDYGIDMWNGIYYKLSEDGDTLSGALHEMNMDILSAPPDAGNLRPDSAKGSARKRPGQPLAAQIDYRVITRSAIPDRPG